VGRALIQESFEDLSEKPAGGLHADVRVEADDRKGRERLCKCGARPAFAEAQFCEAKDGRIAPFGYCFAAFELRKPRKGQTHLFFTHDEHRYGCGFARSSAGGPG
jgi:hypothetical protein